MTLSDKIGLDPEQEVVVNYPESCFCVAGPGSGKTRTLVAKAEKLYSENKDLVCLTFTRSAAREMRDRMPGLLARTVHSFCFSEVKYRNDYDRLLVDFLDKKSKPHFQWVLVDEVQDLTEDQLEVVLSIVGERLFAVGDPYQSIYEFNGALGGRVMTRLLNFGCKRFDLKRNYRSCSNVVTLLNQIYPRDLVSVETRETGLTAILARTNDDVKEVSDCLDSHSIPYTVRYGASELRSKGQIFRGSDKLLLMTCHCSKGLEFDWVLLYKWNFERAEEEFVSLSDLKLFTDESPEDKNLFYVSVARASKGFWRAKNLESLLSALKSLKEKELI